MRFWLDFYHISIVFSIIGYSSKPLIHDSDISTVFFAGKISGVSFAEVGRTCDAVTYFFHVYDLRILLEAG